MKNEIKVVNSSEVNYQPKQSCHRTFLLPFTGLALALSQLVVLFTINAGAKKVSSFDPKSTPNSSTMDDSIDSSSEVENSFIYNSNLPKESMNLTYLSSAIKAKAAYGLNLYIDDNLFIPRNVNGEEVFPFILNSTTNVPLRAALEPFGITFNWNQATRTVQLFTDKMHSPEIDAEGQRNSVIRYKDITAYTDNKIEIDGKPFQFDQPILNVEGTIFLPIRPILEHLGIAIEWDQATHSVYMGSHQKKVDMQGSDYTPEGRDMPLEYTLTEVNNYVTLLMPYMPKIQDRKLALSRTGSNSDQIMEELISLKLNENDPKLKSNIDRIYELSGQLFDYSKMLGNYDITSEAKDIEKIHNKYKNGQSLTTDEIDTIYTAYYFLKKEYENIDVDLEKISDENLLKITNEMQTLLTTIKNQIGYKSSNPTSNFMRITNLHRSDGSNSQTSLKRAIHHKDNRTSQRYVKLLSYINAK